MTMDKKKTGTRRTKGFIFTVDALLGIAALVLIASLLATNTTHANTQTNSDWRQVQITLTNQSRYLVDGAVPANNLPAAVAAKPSYYCHKTITLNPATGAATSATYCEETP